MKWRPIIIIRATQKKMMSKPVTSVVGRVVAGELGRLVRPAERRERPQRRGEPGVEDVLVARQRVARAVVRVGRGLPPPPRRQRRTPCRPARTTPESGGPTRAGARCTRAGCSPSSRSRSSPSSSGRRSCGPRAPTRSPAAASVLASTYHWSVRYGSMTVRLRLLAVRDTVDVVLDLLDQATRFHHLDDALARREAVEAVELLVTVIVEALSPFSARGWPPVRHDHRSRTASR